MSESKIKESDFVKCDCELGGYSLHCSKEQCEELLKHQRISLAIQKIAESHNTIPYQLMLQYETLKQKEDHIDNIIATLESLLEKCKDIKA